MSLPTNESLLEAYAESEDRIARFGLTALAGLSFTAIQVSALTVGNITNQFEEVAAYPNSAIGVAISLYGLKKLVTARKQNRENLTVLTERMRYEAFMPPVRLAPTNIQIAEIIDLPESLPEAEAA